MSTRVVNRHTHRFDVYIGRGTSWGNKFVARRRSEREHLRVIGLYRRWFLTRLHDPVFRALTLDLKGKVLGCSCKPLPCHGDIIKDWLEGTLQ